MKEDDVIISINGISMEGKSHEDAMYIVDSSQDSITFEISRYKILIFIYFLRTKLPNSEQSYKGKVKTHKYINRQNQSTTGKL
jgi:hypothetical protein